MRTGCLHVPDISLAALWRAEPGLRGQPVGITEGRGSRVRVVACSPEARAGGVTPGMLAAGARGLLPGLVLRPFSDSQVRSAQAAMLDVARSFSPRVAREPGGEVCLDLRGLSSLFPGESKLGSALLARARQTGLDARAGIASTRFCALLAARTSQGLHVVAPGEEAAFLAPLPVSLLEASAELNAALQRFGIERLGQLAVLPPQGLRLRLGAAGLRLWRLARGEDEAPLQPDPSPDRFVEETGSDHPLDRIEPLLFVLRGVFERLSQRLQVRGMTARGLFLSCGLDPTGADERALQLASPSPQVSTWLCVARLSLEEQPPRAPVIRVCAEAEAMPVRRSQLDLFAAASSRAGPSPARLDDALARLAALAGEGRVGSPRPVDSHRPEAFTVAPFGTRIARPVRLPHPGVLLQAVRPPEEVEVQLRRKLPSRLRSGWIRGRVRQLAGPWRLEGEWWERRDLNRDYYEIELSDGGVYRLYQDRATERWFVDGICG